MWTDCFLILEGPAFRRSKLSRRRRAKQLPRYWLCLQNTPTGFSKGQGGDPNPREWILQAWNTEDPGTVHKLTVRDNQFVSDSLSVNIFEAVRKEINIPLAAVRVDSGSA